MIVVLNYKEIKIYLFVIISCFFSACLTASTSETDVLALEKLLSSNPHTRKVVKEREKESHRRNACESHHEPCHKSRGGTELLEEVLGGKTAKDSCESPEEHRLKVKTVRILEIDGGAMRGIMPATVLKKIEEETRQPISDLFHMVGGTSVGCLLSCGLTIPSETNKSRPRWSAKQLSNMLKTEASKVFRWRIPLWSIYDTGALETLAEEKCGNTIFDQSIIPSVGITFNCLAAKPKVICSWETEEIFRTKDVFLASSAVPFVFYPRIIYPVNFNAPDHRYLVADGFLGANNSTAILVAKARKLFPNVENFEILSLGNGITKDPMYCRVFKGGLSLTNYALRIFDLGLNAVSSEPDEYAKDMVLGHYTRINPIVSEGGGPFDASLKNLVSLEKDTETYLEENKKEFDALVERLKKPKD